MWLLTIINNLCECLAESVFVWQPEYVHEYVLPFSLFIFITQIILILIFCGQINNLYDI